MALGRSPLCAWSTARCAAVWALSGDRAAAVDSAWPALQVLFGGHLLCAARQAWAAEDELPAPAPVLVLGVPAGWLDMTFGAPELVCRAWLLEWQPDPAAGAPIRLGRGPAVTAGGAAAAVLRHLL